ncbi:zinc finger protein 250 [Diachasma alloeum]|uniref:zinc finger protein 250 n=1 Tax=Diachasma alloeum TaxID=454923 RepID=UPI0007383907|nr:zinc finger protein 250 [Diachasma alloeum]
MEVESVLICRACMKADGIFLSMYEDDQKKLSEKLAEITNIQIEKDDGLPTVLCPKCAYRTDAFYDFKHQVQDSQKKLRRMFSLEADPAPPADKNPPTWRDSPTPPKSVYILPSIPPCSPQQIEKISIDATYAPPEDSPEDPHGEIKFIPDPNDLEPVETFDELFSQTPPEFSIDDKELIQKEEIPSELQDILESEDVGYTLLYIPPNDVELDLRGDEEPDDPGDDLLEPGICDSLIPEAILPQPPHQSDSPIPMACDKSDSDSDDCLEPPLTLLGSLNDTVVRVKELKTDAGGTIYQCSLCMENYDQLTSILFHTVDNHIPTTGPFFCVVCEKDCDSQKELRSHVKTHTGSNPYTCFLCEKAYSSKRYLKRHMVCHTDYRKHRCPKCGLRFQVKSELEIHATTHLHGAPYVCSQCPRIFNHKGNYKRHLISHLDPQGVRLPKYPCHMCGKRFLNNRTLQTHIRVHTGEKPFTCQVCNRSFSQQGNLLNHMRIHSNPRSYSCEVCGKRFNQRATLRDHALLHTGEKPYVCNVCGVAFTFSAALRRHMWVHAGDKPFGCNFCESRFVGRYDLNRHMKIHSDRPRQKRRRKDQMQQEDAGDSVGSDPLIAEQIIPVVETTFVEHVLMGDDAGHIAPREAEKENVDALFNLIPYS